MFSKVFGGSGLSLIHTSHPPEPPSPYANPFRQLFLLPFFPREQRFLTGDLQTSGCLFTTEGVFLPGFHSTIQESAVSVVLPEDS